MINTQKDLLQKTSSADVKSVLQNHEKFKFKCTACGNCCKGPGEVYFTAEEFENVVRFLQLNSDQKSKLENKLVQSRKNGYLVHSAGTACYFLDRNNRCKVYPVRPLQCRTFPFWPSTFRSISSLEMVESECPGTMSSDPEAREFTALQVTRKVNQTHKNFLQSQDPNQDLFMI